MSDLKATPGPWRWEVRPKSHRVELVSTHRGDSVLRPSRWGMQGAMIEFCRDGLFWPIKTFMAVIKGREHHADWMQTIDHPDAHLIAASHDLYTTIAELVALQDMKLAIESAYPIFEEESANEQHYRDRVALREEYKLRRPAAWMAARAALAKARGEQ